MSARRDDVRLAKIVLSFYLSPPGDTPTAGCSLSHLAPLRERRALAADVAVILVVVSGSRDFSAPNALIPF